MKEFVFAAYPWIMMGSALAVIASSFQEARKQGKEKQFDQRIVIGAGLGIVCSAILFFIGSMENIISCFAMGPLIGMALASMGCNIS